MVFRWVALIFGGLALVGAAAAGIQGWLVEDRTLAAAGQVGDAFAIFGLVALTLAFWSLQLQRNDLASQAAALAEQREQQKAELTVITAQAAAMGELARLVSDARSREELRALAARYGEWLAAIYHLDQVMDIEVLRVEIDLKSGVLVDVPIEKAMAELRRGRANVEAIHAALRLIETQKDLRTEGHQLSISFPSLMQSRVAIKVTASRLKEFLRERQAYKERLKAFVARVEERLGLPPLESPPTNEPATKSASAPGVDSSGENSA